jgi:hypothetical protein
MRAGRMRDARPRTYGARFDLMIKLLALFLVIFVFVYPFV